MQSVLRSVLPTTKALRACCRPQPCYRHCNRRCHTAMGNPTAGIIIIGDEILKGQTHDTNGGFIAGRLTALGVRVCKISTVPDDVTAIRDEVSCFSRRYDHVVTTGGIGPTHDDVTFEAVSQAVDQPLAPSEPLVSLISRYFNTTDLSSAPMKMAHIPLGSTLLYPQDRVTGYKSHYPVVRVNNITVLPGVPKLTERAFSLLDKEIFGCHRNTSTKDVYLSADEVSIADALNSTVKQFPSVTIGSYPDLYHSYYKTHLTFESKSAEEIETARSFLFTKISPSLELTDYVTDSVVNSWQRLTALSDKVPSLAAPIAEALAVLEEALAQYEPQEICVCYNGGKDCLVALHLYYALLHREGGDARREERSVTPTGTGVFGGAEAGKAGVAEGSGGAREDVEGVNNPTESDDNNKHTKTETDATNNLLSPTSNKPLQKITVVYITEDASFPEVTSFVQKSANRYGVDCVVVPGPLKPALASLRTSHPHLKAMVMGTRRTDPYQATMKPLAPTDGNWPRFMRVGPVLSWQYSDIWAFIRGLYLPYCSLYDHGYTSLGNANNTRRNPRLAYTDPLGLPAFRAAYTLPSGESEREGRM